MNLHEEILRLVKEERRLTGLVIEYLQKISEARLYLAFGYSTLFEYCTRALGYSEAGAYRRIVAVRLVQELPEIKEKLSDGRLNLTNLCLAQSLIARESVEVKKEILEKIENCTKRETQEILAEYFPTAQPVKESLRFISGEEALLHVRLSKETVGKLEKIKNKRAHKNPSMNYSELIEDMCDYILKKLEPSPKSKEKNQSKNIRYIPAQLKRKIFQRDNNQCTYVSPITQKRCESKHLLQIDHKIPVSQGGLTTEDNLRLLCQQHHKFVDQFVTWQAPILLETAGQILESKILNSDRSSNGDPDC